MWRLREEGTEQNTGPSMNKMIDFQQIEWDDVLADDCRQLIRLAIREDLDRWQDWTTLCMVPQDAKGTAAIVPREAGVLAGLPAVPLIIDELNATLKCIPRAQDGEPLESGQVAAVIEGATRDLLTCERIILNVLGRLSGIATLTRRFVDAAAGHKVRIYDTRKTTPGWRRLEKYAVRCGGAYNHRAGLFDAILIKDNHLAAAAVRAEDSPNDVETTIAAKAVRQAKAFLAANMPDGIAKGMIVEIEVDTLEQLKSVLPEKPHIVLLDNMSLDELRQAVRMKNELSKDVELEASGGVSLDTVADIAATGVDRISVGALTHSAIALDIGLDWQS